MDAFDVKYNSDSKLELILKNINQGYSQFKVIFSSTDDIEDFILTDSNRIFDKYTGVISINSIGEKLSSIYTCILNEDFEWFKLCAKEVIGGKDIKFERFSEKLKKWYTLNLYKLDNEHIVVLLDDSRSTKKQSCQLLKDVKRLKDIYENFDDAFLVLEGAKIVECNKSAQKIFDVENKDILEKTDFRDFIIDNKDSNHNGTYIFNKLVDGADLEDSTRLEIMIKSFQNKLKYLDVSLTKIPNQPLNYTYLLARDISEKKQLEISLKRSKENYQSLSDSTFEAIFIFERFHCIEANLSASVKFNYNNEEIKRIFFTNLFVENQKQYIKEKFKSNSSKPFEAIAKDKYGNTFDVEVRQKSYSSNGRLRKIIAIRNISETKIAERSLQRFTNVINKSPVVVFIWKNEDGWPVEYVSENISQFGYSADEFINGDLKYADIIHPDDLEKIIQTDKDELSNINSAKIREYRIFDKDDVERWVYDRTWVYKNEKGEIAYLEGVVYDISEVKRSEQELKHNEEKLNAFFNNSVVGVGLISKSGRYILVNRKWSELLGYNLVRAHMLKDSDITYSEDKPLTSEYFNKLKNKEIETINYEKRLVREDGKVFWGNISCSASFDENGELDFLIEIIIDIDSQKKYQIELKERNEFAQKLINSIPNPIYIKDVGGQYIGSNKAFRKLVNVTHEEEIIGKTPYDYFSKDASDFHHSKDQELIKSKEQQSYTCKIKTINGNEYFVILNKALYYDYQGNIAGIIGVIMDVSDQKKMEDDLRKAKVEAEAANIAKSEFLANMSHEIRTPLNAILGYSQILEERLKDSASNRDYTKGILASGNNLLRLINDILDLSKIEAGKLEVKYEPVSLKKTLEEIVQIFSIKAINRNNELKLEFENELPNSLLLDETRIRQILFNLVGNAVKFTEDGVITIKAICNKVKKDNNKYNLILRIKDSGIGIPLDQQTIIFNPFRQQQGQSTREYGGTGLGLSITKRLVEIMDGKISVKSEPGKGAEFEVFLPKVHEASLKDVSESNIIIDPNNIKFRENVKILLVEDIESNRNVVKGFLEKYKFKIFEAENGKIGVDLAKDILPDLILMDMQMPVLDGYTATKLIKLNEKTKHIPVVALTASVIKSEVSEIKYICDDYLKKPLIKSDLLILLAKYFKIEETKINLDIQSNETSILDEFKKDLAKLNSKNKDLIVELFGEIKPKYLKLKKSLYIKDVEIIANEFIEIGKVCNVKSLVEYGNQLIAITETFNIVKIKKQISLVEEFYSLISEKK